MSWVNKPVGFKRDDVEDMDLYEYARSLDNFTALVKRFLREMRDGRTAYSYPTHTTAEALDVDIEVDEGQFL